MKVSAMTCLAITTAILLAVVIFVLLDLAFNWVFYTVCLGQGFLIYTVIRVLKDDYITEKTFRDFYEDRPDLGK